MTLGPTIVVLVGLAGVFAGTHILALLSLPPIVVGIAAARPAERQWSGTPVSEAEPNGAPPIDTEAIYAEKGAS